MNKVNLSTVAERECISPSGKYATFAKEVSVALGREPMSTDLDRRHPFDVSICRVPPGKRNFPFHSHSAQWEFYQVLSGKGVVRHADGETPIATGDAFVFRPGEPHQLLNDGSEDLVVSVVADNPIGESCHYPDSGKWLVRSPERALIRSKPLDYWDGED